MTKGMFVFTRSPSYRGIVAAGLLAAPLCWASVPAQAGWEVAHANGANTGFVDVITAPAGSGSLSVPGLGHFAPGSGPVVAPDGTVYLGTIEGKLIALHADGSPFWSRDITPGQAILASPAVGADGSIYVVGTKSLTIRDNRGSGKTKTRRVFEATLHKFLPGGGWVAQTPFPQHGGGAATSAPPNILRTGSVELVLVPAVYVHPPIREVRVIAFATDGSVVGDQRVISDAGTVTGGGDISLGHLFCLVPVIGTLECLICGGPGCDFAPTPAGKVQPPPLPGVAIFKFAGGGAPWVIVSDQLHDIVGYTVSTNAVFTENFRVHDEAHAFASPPMSLPNGHTLVGTKDGAVVFAGPNLTKAGPVAKLGSVIAAPTMLRDGRVIVVQTNGKVAVLQGGKLVTNGQFAGGSIASAAASRTHVFVSTGEALTTLDAATLAVARSFDWVGGGVSPPAIGPLGHVYAIASNILFVFPPPKTGAQTGAQVGGQTVGQIVTIAPGAATMPKAVGTTTAALSPKRFDDPKGPGGLRLYACTAVGGEACGAPVATAFCQSQGFAKAGRNDVDNEKVKAETLSGQVCTKKRCKVFEYIECRN